MLSYYYCPELLIKFYFPQGLLVSRLVKKENIMQSYDLYGVQ